MQKLLKCRAETLLCVHEWIEQDNNPRSVLVPTHQEFVELIGQTKALSRTHRLFGLLI